LSWPASWPRLALMNPQAAPTAIAQFEPPSRPQNRTDLRYYRFDDGVARLVRFVGRPGRGKEFYLDGFALRVRSGGKVVSVPVLGVVGVLTDGRKHLLALELCAGESFVAWKGCLDDLVARGLRAPVLAIIDGNAGLRRAVGEVWARAAVQRCSVHKLRNLERKAPKHALAEIRDDFHRIVYAVSAAFERTWGKGWPGVVASLREGGDELLTFFSFPKAQWKTLRSTNVIERLHEEFRRRVKTQSSLPSEDAALILLFSLVASGQIKLRRIDGWRKIAAVLSQHTAVAA
jgi:putative transposase